jgi:hypothetical protein
MGKLHKERAVTRRIFQTLPTQTDTTVALIYKILEMITEICLFESFFLFFPCMYRLKS